MIPLKNRTIIAILISVFFLTNTSLTLNAASATDNDNDDLPDDQEKTIFHTNPLLADTDGDGYDDGEEITNGYSPRHSEPIKMIDSDSDKDYLTDAWEIIIGANLLQPDTDGDLHLDGTEVKAGYNPLSIEKGKLKKHIIVDLQNQTLNYYFEDKLLDGFLISSGVTGLPTPKGDFSVLEKIPLKHYDGTNFNYPDTKWNLHFATTNWRYYIHGAYWHNNFGRPMSHGCVNVAYENMEKLYWFAEIGTSIKIN